MFNLKINSKSAGLKVYSSKVAVYFPIYSLTCVLAFPEDLRDREGQLTREKGAPFLCGLRLCTF